VVLDTAKLPWEGSATPGANLKTLYLQPGFSDVTRLERWAPGADLGAMSYEQGAEFFVLDGGFADEAGAYSEGYWLRLPAGCVHHPRSERGCTLYVKRAGLPYLKSAA
jgi:anti-sigma factor ChrR (cupin superfamily)